MYFGVYEAERYSLRGKLIVKLIWLFPFAAIVFLVLAWSASGWFALVPFVYIFIVWSIRANKKINAGQVKQYQSKQDNLGARQRDLDYRWESWAQIDANNTYLLLVFFAPSRESADQFRAGILKEEKLHGEIEQSSYDNESLTLHVRIQLESVNRKLIEVILKRMIDKAWDNNCELLSLDVMEEHE